MKPIPSPQDQGWNEEVIQILKRLGSLHAEYPPELLASRRAAFLGQVREQEQGWAENDPVADGQFVQRLESLKAVEAEYPAALLAARRAAFLKSLQHYQRAEMAEGVQPEDQQISQLFQSLKSAEADYPATLIAARRASFRRQLALGEYVSVLEALRTALRNLFFRQEKTSPWPGMNRMRTSLVVLAMLLVAFVGSLLRNPVQPLRPTASQSWTQPGGHNSAAEGTSQVAKVICRPGYLPPLCLVKPVEDRSDLSFQGNGLARPAVAKDTLPGYGEIHKAAYLNDGLYGPGASWVSNSPYSWIKIDLGKATTINTIAFGKDRLGNSSGGDPGRFVIAVALSDDIYADGNSSNDYVEYTQVYDSKRAGFNGVISGAETVQAEFEPVTVRYIKIIFANPRTAVDEVEAFMRPPVVANFPTKRPPKGSGPGGVPNVIPSATALPPTNTPVPPTDTPLPPPTDTPVPPTDTPLPPPTATPLPPTDAPVPVPTDTPGPPAANLVQPTDTSLPPESLQPVSVPTDTPISS